ncbi:MAG: tripartite tricarboxylate transporter substrate binding protein [Betaproteobacteria bacterium]|nr:tripartite tricarboxylate transporter substrate binding protein [Betaproteobacteria bacterium]
MKALISALLCAALWAITSSQSMSQAWPSKPVRIVVSTGPGLSTDIVARLLADHLSRAVGQQFVVENIAGAGGNIAAQAVTRSAPDGYTMLFTGGGTLVTNMYAFKSLPFDPARDFAPVSLITKSSGFLIAVTAALAAKSINEVIILARTQPGGLSYAADVSNIYLQLVMRMLNREAGIELIEIPYKSTPQAIQDTIAGRTQVIIGSAAALQAAIKAGKLRLVAVTASSRNPSFPDIPSLIELYPALNMDAVGFAVVAPAATSREVVQRLNRFIAAILKQAQFEEQLAAQGLAAAALLSPDQVSEELNGQRQRWGRIFKDLNIQAQ